MTRPLVTVAIPVFNEALHIDACLDAVDAQTYGNVVEVLIVDGGSTDATREIVARRGGKVRLLHNPRRSALAARRGGTGRLLHTAGRSQAAALNVALAEARGEVFVRVDGHCTLAGDYVVRCVGALSATGAAMVGGAMNPQGDGWLGWG